MDICSSINQTLHFLSLPLVLFLLSSAAFPSSASQQQDNGNRVKKDAEALLLFKKMIDTKNPDNILSSWQISKSPCKWQGVTCNAVGRVAAVDLSWSYLDGPINFAPFGSLDMLTSLNLSTNYFTVNTSSLLQLPSGLQELELSSVGFRGPLPVSDLFSKCPNLVSVDLSYNNFSGFEPSDMLLIPNKLERLDISFNRLTGPLSIDGSSCRSLTSLDLSSNQIKGPIPVSLSNCTSLNSLNFSTNLLSGEIPKAIGKLVNLQRVDFSHNHLTGSVPSQLVEACHSLVEIRLSYNNMTGSLPEALGFCSWLQILDISNNNLSGLFPESVLSNMSSLEMLLLSNNAISGPLPATISGCKKLRAVDFSSNRLSGIIPPDLCPAGEAPWSLV